MDAVFFICAVAAVTATVALYRLRSRWPALFAGWVYYIVVLAPMAGLAQSGPQLVADRYSYLSCLSWPLLLGGRVARLWLPSGSSLRQPWTIVLSATAILVPIALGTLSWQQSKVWRDTRTLWQRVIAVAPGSSLAHYNLARLYEDEGKLDDSLAHYRRAIEVRSRLKSTMSERFNCCNPKPCRRRAIAKHAREHGA